MSDNTTLPNENGPLSKWWNDLYAVQDPYGTTGRWYTERKRMLNTVGLLPAERIFENVLDLGCGEGNLIGQIIARCKRATCVDISSNALERAKKNVGEGNIKFICENMYTVSFPPASFDLIVAVESLDYTKEAEQQVAKWKEWLVPGGLILTSAPNLRDYHPYDRFISYFVNNGLTIVKEEPVSTKFFLRVFINRGLIPFPDYFFGLSMRITKKYSRLLTKHLALLVSNTPGAL